MCNNQHFWKKRFQIDFDNSERTEDDWKALYKYESLVCWEGSVGKCNPSIVCLNKNKTAKKIPFEGWDNYHSNVRTKRGFRVS
jgi:hypothetical protein